MAGPKSLLERAKANYYREGVSALIQSFPTAIPKIFANLLLGVKAKIVYESVKNRILTRDDLKQRASSRGQIWKYAAKEQFTIDYDGDRLLPEPLQSRRGSFERPQPFLSKLNGAKLLWEGGPAVTRDGNIVLETVENDELVLQRRIESALRRWNLRTVLIEITAHNIHSDPLESGTFFPLVRHPTTNFYHWMGEYLPKLRALEEYKQMTGESPTLLIEEDPPDWVIESLELMEYGPKDWRRWSNENLRFNELLIPLHQSRTPNSPDIPSPSECQYLKSRILSNIQGGEQSCDRIFVSRQQAEDRRVSNYDEIKDVLDEFGFETFILERMRLSDQISLFSQAEIIVAPHGAGLTHLIFAENPCIIELLPQTQTPHHYFCLSRMLGYEYEFVKNSDFGVDMKVNPEKLRSVINETIG